MISNTSLIVNMDKNTILNEIILYHVSIQSSRKKSKLLLCLFTQNRGGRKFIKNIKISLFIFEFIFVTNNY